MKNKNIGLETVEQKLKKANLKITPQRLAILNELENNCNHPSADLVYQKIKKKLPNISFDTVNRTLITFAQSGVIKIAEAQGGARRYDPITKQHHHFHCVVCNTIIDFEYKKYDEIKLPAIITKTNKVFNQKIVLDGVCKNCKEIKVKNFKVKNNNY